VATDLAEGLSKELPSLPAVIAVGLIVASMVGMISAAIAALTPRRAYATVAIIAVFLVPSIAAAMLVEFETGLLGQIAVLLSPADVLEGVNATLFGSWFDESAARDSDIEGWAFVAAALAWIAGSTVVLARRYRSIAT